MSKQAVVQESWFELAQRKIGSFFDSLDLSYEAIKNLAVYGAIGFACGFLLKRYGTIILVAAIIAACLIYGLASTDFITIHSEQLKLYFGFAHKATLAEVGELYWNWITNNVPLAVSIAVGFIAGYKIG
jgi:uncharacterized membrane protein (Fun14 family)